MSVNIYRFTDQTRLDEFRRVFAAGLGETTREHWIWRLFTPNGSIQPEAFAAENENGEIVAVSSVLPQIYGDREYKCALMCDWVVRPDCRGQGLIGQLYRFAYDHYRNSGFDFLMVFPNENSYPILMKYGFDDKGNVGCWSSKQRLFFSKLPKNIQKDGIQFVFSDFCLIEKFPLLSERIMRTAEFMRWKYDLNPDTDYHWLTVKRGNDMIGYFVYALTKGRIRTAVTVYDWEFDGNEENAFLTAVRALRRLGNMVSIWGQYGNEDQKLLKDAGLHDKKNGAKLVLKPLSEKGYPKDLTLTRVDTDY